MFRIDNLNVSVETNMNQKEILHDISLTIKDGDFITIVGNNGAGKSTLFKAISGTMSATGTIEADDLNINKLPAYKRSAFIAQIYQDPLTALASDLSVEECLLMALKPKKFSFKQVLTKRNHKALLDLLETYEFDLKDHLRTPISKLSGGERQCVALLMATINNPSLLLLDEHTAALDPINKEKILRLTNDIIKSKHINSLMITHTIADAIELGNRLLVMKDGRIVKDYNEEEKKTLTVTDIEALLA